MDERWRQIHAPAGRRRRTTHPVAAILCSAQRSVALHTLPSFEEYCHSGRQFSPPVLRFRAMKHTSYRRLARHWEGNMTKTSLSPSLLATSIILLMEASPVHAQATRYLGVGSWR